MYSTAPKGSYENIREQLRGEVKDFLVTKGKLSVADLTGPNWCSVCIVATFAESVIVCISGSEDTKHYRLGYTLDKEGNAILNDDAPEAVDLETVVKAVASSAEEETIQLRGRALRETISQSILNRLGQLGALKYITEDTYMSFLKSGKFEEAEFIPVTSFARATNLNASDARKSAGGSSPKFPSGSPGSGGDDARAANQKTSDARRSAASGSSAKFPSGISQTANARGKFSTKDRSKGGSPTVESLTKRVFEALSGMNGVEGPDGRIVQTVDPMQIRQLKSLSRALAANKLAAYDMALEHVGGSYITHEGVQGAIRKGMVPVSKR